MAYSKNAFVCHRCPGKAGDGGCPAWWETIHQNVQTGEQRVVKGCAWEQLPLYLTEVIRASNRPAAEIGAMRDETVRGLAQIATVMTARMPERLAAPVPDDE